MSSSSPSLPTDLPVAVRLEGVLGREVRAWVESELGWQTVQPEGPPRPLLTLCGHEDAFPDAVVVVDGAVEVSSVRTALQSGARDVIGWPDDRARLPELAARVARRPLRSGPPVLRVAGVGGGVGTSTVALALAGLSAWSGRETVAVGEDLVELCGAGPWNGPGLAEVLALGPVDGAAEVASLAREVSGVKGLSVLGGRGGAGPADVGDVAEWPAALVVVDVGVDAGDADLLVAAPDSRVSRAATRTAPLLMVGEGSLGRSQVRAMAGRRRVGWLPNSARVARAAVQARVPANLPGTWLRALRKAVAATGAS